MIRTILVLSLLGLSQAQEVSQVKTTGADGVWEGEPQQVSLGQCVTAGTLKPLSVTISIANDGTLIGDIDGFSTDARWRGRIVDQRIVFQVPRQSTCEEKEQRYSITLEGSIIEKAGMKQLMLSGVDEPCSQMRCRFQYNVTLTWKRAIEAKPK